MILLTDFLDQHMHAFGLTELSYFSLIVIATSHDQISYECRAEFVCRYPPLQSIMFSCVTKARLHTYKGVQGDNSKRGSPNSTLPGCFAGHPEEPSAHHGPSPHDQRSAWAQWQVGTQFMHSGEGTPCLGPSQDCSRKVSAPDSGGKPIKISQGERVSEAVSWLRSGYCLGVWNPLRNAGEEYLGIALGLCDVKGKNQQQGKQVTSVVWGETNLRK